MTLAPGRPDARSLVSMGKTAAADGLAVLTLARPPLGALGPLPVPAPARALATARYHLVITRYHAVITGDARVLFKTLDSCKI
jgi:hypothetical protein